MSLNYSKLTNSSAAFNEMIKRFGIITVMNAKVYEPLANDTLKGNKADAIVGLYEAATPICELDTLKVANVSEEGPTKTITGGQYANPLVKYGKTARLEMQDALGNAAAIEALCGGLREADDINLATVDALHFGQDFESEKTIIGDSFFIDQKTGLQVPVKIIFYKFLPDSIFNLTQDAEGDASVFDMNGDLLTTDILVSTKDGGSMVHGVFYSIVNPTIASSESLFTISNAGVITIAANHTATFNGNAVTSESTEIEEGTAGRLVIKDNSNVVVYDEIISR